MYDPSQLYTDPVLTNFSIGYEEQNLYGTEILPITPVSSPSGSYRIFDRSSWVMFPDIRAPGTVANEVRGGKWSQDVYKTEEHSLQAPVLDEERRELTSQGGLANPVFGGTLQLDPEEDATELVTGSILRGMEKLIADLVRNTANYAAGHSITLGGTDQWDLYAQAGSDPVDDIRTATIKIWSATRRYPNVLAMPAMAVPWLENHPKIIDRFKSFTLTQPDAFRALTGFEGKIVLTDSVYNAADNIDATESITDFWGKDVWLGIVDPTPGQRTRTFGKTFSLLYESGDLRPIDRWREEARKADLVRASQSYDCKVVSNVAGYIIKTAFSTTAF